MEELLAGLKALKKTEEERRVHDASMKKGNRQKFHMKYSSSSSSDSASLSPFLDQPSRENWHLPASKARQVLAQLRESINLDERKLKEENPVDSKNQMGYLQKFLQNVKEATVEDEAGEETGGMHVNRKDEIALGRLEESRPIWMKIMLLVVFHVMVFGNFLISWMDTAALILEDAKMKDWLLADDYNCLDLVPNADAFDHLVNIIHALLSCSVLYVQNKNSARLCLAWIGSQAIHTIFRAFQFFFSLKFDNEAFEDMGWSYTLLWTVLFNAFGSLVILHKYYEITNRIQNPKQFVRKDKSAERALNDSIIYRNETFFLQRKKIMREVTTAQTGVIIKKIGKHANLGLRIDPLTLDREINAAKLALADCATANIKSIPYVLKKSHAYWLVELEKKQRDELAREKMLKKMPADPDKIVYRSSSEIRLDWKGIAMK